MTALTILSIAAFIVIFITLIAIFVLSICRAASNGDSILDQGKERKE